MGFSPTVPAGSNGQVQANSNGQFAGLTQAALTALIAVATVSLPGAVPASGGGTSNYLRADMTWAPPPGDITAVNGNVIIGNATSDGIIDSGTLLSSLAPKASPTFTGGVTVSSAAFGLSGNISGAGIIGTTGIRYKNTAATLTDTSSSGTIATAYTDVWGGNTIAASSATTVTNYYGSYFKAAIAGSGITLTNNYALGADSCNVGTSGVFKVSTAGVLTTTGAQFTTPSLGDATATSIAIGGATIGANALAVTGTSTYSGTITTTSGASVVANGSLSAGQDISSSYAPVVSRSALTLSGTPNASGTGTTTFPLMYLNTTGSTQPTTLNTGGTFLGINAPSGYNGYFLDFRKNGGASLFNADAFGNFTAGASFTSTAGATALSATNYSLTSASASSLVNLAGTLNTSGSPDVIKLAITNTAAGASAKLLNLYAGASGTSSVFSIDLAGNLVSTGQLFAGTNIYSGGGSEIGWNGRATLTSPSANLTQFGKADVDTAPAAQTLRTQGTIAGGTSNVAGANWTDIVSPGKGTGIGGSRIFQTAPAGSTGTAVNAAITRLTLDGPGNVVAGNAALATNVTDGFLYIATCAGTPTGVPTTYTGRVALIYDTTAHQFWIYDGGWKQPKTPAGAATVTWQ